MKVHQNYFLRQIRVPDKLYYGLKQYCRRRKMTLIRFYHEMMEWFLRLHGKGEDLLYQASYKNGHVLSLWIGEDHLKCVKDLSLNAKVSDARVIYTALMLYTETLNDFYMMI